MALLSNRIGTYIMTQILSHVQVVRHHPSLLLTSFMNLGKFHHSEPPFICKKLRITVPTFHCGITVRLKKITKVL